MSLRDGRVKMSKSDENERSRINLTDSVEEVKPPSCTPRTKITEGLLFFQIQFKLQKAKTDSLTGITYDPENRPGIPWRSGPFDACKTYYRRGQNSQIFCASFLCSPTVLLSLSAKNTLARKCLILRRLSYHIYWYEQHLLFRHRS